MSLHSLVRGNRGVVLAATLILLILVVIVAVAVLATVYATTTLSISKEDHIKALHLAEEGLNYALLDMHTLGAALPQKITLPAG